MKSILQDENDKRCFLCGGYGAFECHHIFGGAYRKKSEKYGLKSACTTVATTNRLTAYITT